jgi:hypothetical protein
MPGSKYLWYRWSENGRRYAVSLQTEDEATAVIEKQKIVRDVALRGSESYGKKNGEPVVANQFAKVVREYLAEGQNRDRKAMTPRTAKNLGYLLNQFAKESSH